ncbi:hypothetical protein PQX77_003535 [Marasmius sp. AFHP31]|nr:hypothetical protein PQX77_003535 [Marasmius sp. AFHP31]
MWTTAIYLVGNGHTQDEDIPKQLALLRELMLHIPSDREVILQEMIFRLIILERYQDALDELELYLPSFPYQDSPVLHTYAGLLSFCLSQSSERGGEGPHFNESTLREAKSHFERAVTLDSENVVATSFLEKISALQDRKSGQNQDSDDDFEMNAGDTIDIGTPKRKRVRTTSTTREVI